MSTNKASQISLLLGLFLVGLLVIPGQALALTIQLQDQGGANFYQDQVLGKGSDSNSDSDSEKHETESEPAQLAPTEQVTQHQQEVKSETEHPVEPTETREVHKSEGESTKPRVTPTPKPLIRNEKRKIEIKSSANKGLKVELKQEKKSSAAVEKVETLETQRINVKLPKSKLGEVMERELELHKDATTDDLNISSAGVTATTKAEFLIDPVSNEVKVKTSSGQEHELQHLPDQAAAALVTDKKVIQNSDQPSDIELTENKNGEVVYHASVTEEKRFLGIFSWKKPKTVELVDQTGEVRDVTPVTNSNANPMTWLLERFSF